MRFKGMDQQEKKNNWRLHLLHYIAWKDAATSKEKFPSDLQSSRMCIKKAGCTSTQNFSKMMRL